MKNCTPKLMSIALGLLFTQLMLAQTVFSDVEYFGDAANWEPDNAANWDVREDPKGDNDFNLSYYMLNRGGTDAESPEVRRFSLIKDRMYTDFEMNLQARVNETSGFRDFVILFAYKSPTDYLIASFNQTFSACGLYKYDGTNRTPLVIATVGANLPDRDAVGTYGNYSFRREGNKVVARAEGVILFEYQGDEVLGEGRLGIGSQNDKVFFDDIRVSTPPFNQAPVAAFTASVISGESPLTVNFNASGSSDPDGDALTYTWTFGDGSAPVQGTMVTHTFNDFGEFLVTLSVNDSITGITSTSQTITVNTPPGLRVIVASDDAGTRQGANPCRNYDTQPDQRQYPEVIRVQRKTADDDPNTLESVFNMHSFLKFPLTSLNNVDLNDVNKIELSLYVISAFVEQPDDSPFDKIENKLFYSPEDTWDDSTVAWCNRPQVLATPLAIYNLDRGGEYRVQIDITDIAKAELGTNGNDTISFMIAIDQVAEFNGGRFGTGTIYAAMGHPEPVKHPRLLVSGDFTSSASDLYQEIGAKVFPNPTNGVLNLTNDAGRQFENIQILDLSGKLLQEYNKVGKELNILHLAKGMYLMKVRTDKGEQGTFKIIKQ